MSRFAVAGVAVFEAIRAERETLPKDARGFFLSEPLCACQRHQAARGFIEAELVESIYGWSVRYASGLHGFALLASARASAVDGSRADAERWAAEWVAEDPAHRFVTAMTAEAAS